MTRTTIFLLLLTPTLLTAQNREFRAGSLVIDDDAADGTRNTIRIEAPASLGQDIVLTIPDPGTGTASFLLSNGASSSWLLGGNAGTTAGTSYLGTSDNVALHLYVNAGTNNGLILNTNGSLQRGVAGNNRGVNAVDMQRVRVDANQVASGVSSVVAGGERNRASSNRATVSGGFGNTASDVDATVAGGTLNTASDWGSVVSGGQRNNATGFISTISGGARNTVDGQYCAIIGGRGLTLNGDGSFGFLSNNYGGSLSGSNRMTVDSSEIGLVGNADLWLANNDGEASRLLFWESNTIVGPFPDATVHYTSFEAGAQTVDIEYVLPIAAPSSDGQLLSSTTGGTMSWVDGPTGAQSFSNGSTAVATLRLENSIGTDDGTALEIAAGRMILSTGTGAPATLPDDVVAYEIDDATATSAPTVALPASGSNGQVLYLYISDPDGATVAGVARATGDRLTYLHLAGAWQLFHAN